MLEKFIDFCSGDSTNYVFFLFRKFKYNFFLKKIKLVIPTTHVSKKFPLLLLLYIVI